MNTPLWALLLLAAVSVAMLYVGLRLKVYSRSGALVSAIVLAIVMAGMGWAWAIPVLVFLGSQIYWSLLGISSPQKARATGQSLGGVSMAARLGWPVAMAATQLFQSAFAFFPAFVGALAVATADVWATQLGLLSKEKPRLLTSRIAVPHGTPGAISTLGLVAALGGAWLMGLVALLTSGLPVLVTQQSWPQDRLWLPLATSIGGLTGMLVDSVLAQTAQAVYYCEVCEQFSQQEIDSKGHRCKYVRGITWMSDETIDLISAILGALVTAICLGMLN